MLATHSFHKYLLSIYCVPDTVLGTGDERTHKKDKVSVLMQLTVYWKEMFINVLFLMSGDEKYYNEKKKKG